MPKLSTVVSVDDIRDIYPGEDDSKLQQHLDEAISWVTYYAPCADTDTFAASKANLAKSVVLRALRYDKMSSEGALQQTQTGPVGITLDTRRPRTSTLFSPGQIEVLRTMCQVTSAGQNQAVPVSVPLSNPQMPYGW
jgi:hypothetical protein